MINFFKRVAALLCPDKQSQRIAASQLRESGTRLHLILAAVLYMTLSIGSFYLIELVMLPIPWRTLYTDAPSLYRLLDTLYYVLDGAIILFLILPLGFGTARIFYTASQGARAALSDMFLPFQSARCYFRATLVMLLLVLPRLLSLWLVCWLWQEADRQPLGVRLLLYALAVLLFAAESLLLTLDDAVLPLALDDESLGVRALWRTSVRRCYDHMLAIWRFKLGYFGWAVLSVLSLGTLLICHALPLYALAHKPYLDRIIPIESNTEPNTAHRGSSI